MKLDSVDDSLWAYIGFLRHVGECKYLLLNLEEYRFESYQISTFTARQDRLHQP